MCSSTKRMINHQMTRISGSGYNEPVGSRIIMSLIMRMEDERIRLRIVDAVRSPGLSPSGFSPSSPRIRSFLCSGRMEVKIQRMKKKSPVV